MVNEKTMWETIQSALESHGIDTYPPATKIGECKSPYVVLKEDGSSQIAGFSSEQRYFTFILYVPKNSYTMLSRLKEQVKEVVRSDLYPTLMPAGSETPDFYEDSIKAHTSSIIYRNNVRNNHL